MLQKISLGYKLIDSTTDKLFTHIEHLDCFITSKKQTVRLCLVYRPPPSRKNGLKNSTFFEEWVTYLERLALVPQQVIIMGDVNFHLDKPNNADTRKFVSLLSHGFSQHVNEPTHKKGHTLTH